MAYIDERLELTEVLRRMCAGARKKFSRFKMESDCKRLGKIINDLNK